MSRPFFVSNYPVTTANGKGLFNARNSPVIRLRSAFFNSANDTVTLTPRKAFALNKPVQLTINGTSPSGLHDSTGRLIDGDRNGTVGGNAVALIRRTGVTLNPAPPALRGVSNAAYTVSPAVLSEMRLMTSPARVERAAHHD